MKKCSPRRLVSSSQVNIDHCPECGVVHLHVGPVSLRLDEATLETLAHGLAAARAEVAPASAPLGWGLDAARA